MDLSFKEAVLKLRSDPQYEQAMQNAYLDGDVLQAVDRFLISEEWRELSSMLQKILSSGDSILDLGSGNGFVSLVFGKAGYEVFSVEPSECALFGAGALGDALSAEPLPNVHSISTHAESLPFESSTIKCVYSRQVLHHVNDLRAVASEVHRVLQPGGTWLATREHVISSSAQLQEFLLGHPIHQLCNNENAFRLSEYQNSFKRLFDEEKILGPYDSVLNYAPLTKQDINLWLKNGLSKRFGTQFGSYLARSRTLFRWYCSTLSKRCDTPGRMYSFILRRR